VNINNKNVKQEQNDT